MNFISILGIFLLLGIAWALSYHKREINIRPIFWGIGLQLIFALIILREDYWSFIGMSLLSLLIITYIHQKDNETLGGGIKAAIIIIIISSILGYLLINIPLFPKIFLICTTAFLILNSLFKWNQNSQRFAGSLFVISGTALLISNDLFGKLIFQINHLKLVELYLK